MPMTVDSTKTIDQVTPTGDKLVVEKIDYEEVTDSGIILPFGHPEHARHGRVLAVGPGPMIRKGLRSGQRTKMTVKVGDHVIFGKYIGMDLTFNNKRYIIMHESNVLGVLNDA